MDDRSLFEKIYSLSDRQITKKYKYLGEGISRQVYAIDKNYVVKISKNSDGIYQNRIENYVYTNVDENLKKYLCPILCFNPDRIIMRRAIPIYKYQKSKWVDLNEIRPEESSHNDLNKLATKFMLEYEDVISASSWGVYNNENVLIDYGCTSYFGDFVYSALFKW
jgi:hypothetical protein